MSKLKGFKTYKTYWEDQAEFMDKFPWDRQKIAKLTILNEFENELKSLQCSNHSLTKEDGQLILRLKIPYNYHELDDFKIKAKKFKPKAVWVVHIGGHIAFDIEKIANYCKENNIFLIEDCAHSHGAEWNGQKPGSWGIAGIYSMYATKTISTGEGGMLVSNNKKVINHSLKYRNYGKFEHTIDGLNFRMSEFTAALGVVQIKRLPEIIRWKNDYARNYLDALHPNRIYFPEGMLSGYYKYIVFDELEKSTGKVYDEPCHKIMKHDISLPNTDWISKNHWCVPLYYHPDIEVSK